MYYFRDPINMGCFFSFSLPPSADCAYVNIVSTNSKQDVLTRPELNTYLLYFSGLSFRDIQKACLSLWALSFREVPCFFASDHESLEIHIVSWVIIKALLKQISLYLLSHSRIRIIVLTCPDNKVCKKSSAEIMRACKITQIAMMHLSLYSWAGVSEQIANKVFFWLVIKTVPSV